MTTQEPVRVFIGSGEASLLERKTLIYSIRKNTKSPVDIYVFNGTHNSIEKNDEPPIPSGMSLRVKYKNFTEFSNYRFMIPTICGNQGRAIFLDSDMVCLGDIADLFNAPMEPGTAMLSKQEAYKGNSGWGLSVILFDCSQCGFDLDKAFDEIDQGLYTYYDLHQMLPGYLKQYPLKLAPIDPNWNMFDQHDEKTKLIHYTNLLKQPWKFPGHPAGDLWFKYFNEARESGFITKEDIDKTKMRAYCRQDILQGNTPPPPSGVITLKIPAVRATLRRLFSPKK